LKQSEVEAELLVMLLVGADTTASAMSWVMAQILAHPPVHEKAMEELKRFFAGDEPTAEKLDQLRYLDAVIHEACRLSPLLLNSAAPFDSTLANRRLLPAARNHGIELHVLDPYPCRLLSRASAV
jgi:cytochrome P450